MSESLRWKIPLILALMLMAGYVVVSPYLPESWPKSQLHLGFDLKGGVELRYRVKVDEETPDGGAVQGTGTETADDGAVGESDREKLVDRRQKILAKTDDAIDIITKRLDPAGTKQPDVRSEQSGEIIVRFPGLTRAEVDRIDTLVKQVGVLEFRVVVGDDEYKTLTPEDISRRGIKQYKMTRRSKNADEPDQEIALWIQTIDDYNLTGEDLTDVRKGQDDYGGWAVNFQFKERGADIFERMTRMLAQKGRIAIILNKKLSSAPFVESIIRQSGRITGDFSEQEVKDLVAVLRAGSLPVELELQSKTYVGPELGIDSRERGKFAVMLSFALVVVFMLVYYLLSGAIADLALALNLLFLFAAMMLTRAVLTLPGMAGVILTVGMAVDANVLIYERVREERDSGQALRFAIRNGYARAFTTIFDANLTTLITAIILYWQGTGAVRGFAVTLSIGIVVSMFTALFVTRTIFDLCLSRGWLKERLSMLRLLKRPAINFVRWAPLCIVFSVMLIVAGMVVFIYRGHDNYGIDFASGTSMHLQLKGYVVETSAVTAAGAEKTSTFTVTFKERRGADVPEPVEVTRAVVDEGLRRLADKHGIDLDGIAQEWEDDGAPSSTVTLKVREPQGGTAVGLDLAGKIRKYGEDVFRMRMDISDVRRIVAAAGYPRADVQTAFNDENVVGRHESDQFTIRVRAGGETQTQEERERVPTDIEEAFLGQVEWRSVETEVQVDNGITSTDIGASAEVDNAITGNTVRLSFTETLEDGSTEPFGIRRIHIKRALRDAGFGDAKILWPDRPSKYYFKIAFETSRTDHDAIKKTLEKEGVFSAPAAFVGYYFVGPGQAREIVKKAWVAAALSLVAIVVYVWLRFGALKYGLAAVAALAHDVLFALGALAAGAWLGETPFGERLGIGDVRLSLPIVAGILTIIGYSLNDTIVVFDRVRENVRRRIRELRGKRSDGETLTPEIVDKSINQTLSRTILTSLTTLIVCVTLYVAGGMTLHGLSLCLIIGVAVGTYSSIFIASPILVLTHAVEMRRARARGGLTTEEREVAIERGEIERE